jgi:hypothetical protein
MPRHELVGWYGFKHCALMKLLCTLTRLMMYEPTKTIAREIVEVSMEIRAGNSTCLTTSFINPHSQFYRFDIQRLTVRIFDDEECFTMLIVARSLDEVVADRDEQLIKIMSREAGMGFRRICNYADQRVIVSVLKSAVYNQTEQEAKRQLSRVASERAFMERYSLRYGVLTSLNRAIANGHMRAGRGILMREIDAIMQS